MLADKQVISFVATTQPDKAKAFYADALGLKLVEDAWHAIIFEVGDRRLHIQKLKEFKPQQFTVLGWSVPDIENAVAELAKKGVKFERYPGMEQDGAGIWAPPGGGKVCWFKDPDGNTLSLTEFKRP